MIEENLSQEDHAIHPYDGNLFMLVDFLKFSWDLFIKGNAFYLFAISVMGGFAFSANITWFQKIFVGLAITGASAIAFYATNVSLRFIKNMSVRIDEISSQRNYVTLPFEEHIKIVTIFRFITVVLFLVGLLYIAHVIILDGIPDKWGGS